jgi:hypothetical protein
MVSRGNLVDKFTRECILRGARERCAANAIDQKQLVFIGLET